MQLFGPCALASVALVVGATCLGKNIAGSALASAEVVVLVAALCNLRNRFLLHIHRRSAGPLVYCSARIVCRSAGKGACDLS